MTGLPVSYRVRIRNAADSSDVLVLTSLRGGTNPVIQKEPNGDGQELDPVQSTMATGSYSIDLVDPVIAGSSPPSRVITSQLFDANGRQLLTSRRTFIEISRDGGSTWVLVIGGYLTDYQLYDAITWTFSVGDTRRIENTRTVFDGTSTVFARRGCIFGGPITGGGWGPIPDRRGWKFQVLAILPANLPNNTAAVTYRYVSGYRGINDPVTTKIMSALGAAQGSWDSKANQAVQSYYAPNATTSPASGPAQSYGWPGFTGVSCLVQELVGGANGGVFTPGAIPPINTQDFGNGVLIQGTTDRDPNIYLLWPPGLTLPTVGDIHTISCFTTYTSDVSPVYFDMHPVDIVTGLYNDAGIPYDATSAAAVRTLLGDTLRVAMRITQSTTLLAFLKASVFGPFGFSTRSSLTTGLYEFFVTRLKSSTGPSATIGTIDLQDDSGLIFDTDEATVVSAVRFDTKTFWAYNPNYDTDTSNRPLDSVFSQGISTRIFNPAASALVTNEVNFTIPGMIHDTAGIVQDMIAYTSAVALEMFDRFGSGAPVCDALAVLAASDAGFAVGDEIFVEPAHFPNLNYRFGDNPSVGARIMQILRRTESPAGPLIKVIDAGANQQPVTPAAAITVAANTNQPRTTAQFTITNGAAINTAASLIVAVQWATGASAPANGVSFARYPAGACPTTAVQLPAVAPGSTVWVRARTETPGLRPSAWTAWAGVTLTAVATPSGLSFTNVLKNSVQFNWTNANATDLIDIYLFEGSSAPADWSPWFVCTVPAGSTASTVRNLDGPSVDYVGAVVHRDPSTGINGPFVTGTFTTTSSTGITAPTPQGMEILPTTQDSSLKSGIVLALYAADAVYDMVIQRAPDVSGSPGTFATIAQVRGSTEIYVDSLPITAAIYWYQIQHRLSGTVDSAFTPPLNAIAGGVSAVYVRPPFTLPQLQVVIAQTSSTLTTFTFTVTILDPQNGSGTCLVTPGSTGLASLIDQVTGLPAAPYTATVGVARSFVATLSGVGGSATFTATEVGRYTGYGAISLGAIVATGAPSMTIAIATNDSLTVATAKASAVISAPANAASIKWLASPSSQPLVSAVASGGAVISAGAPLFMIPDLGLNVAVDDTAYLTVVYYDSASNQLTAAQGQATRATIQATKTAIFSVGNLSPNDSSALNFMRTAGQLGLKTNVAAGSGFIVWSQNVSFPVGATLINVAFNNFWSSSVPQGGVTQALVRTVAGGGGTALANPAATNIGWQTLNASLSELIAGDAYRIDAGIKIPSSTIESMIGNVAVTYTVPDLISTI